MFFVLCLHTVQEGAGLCIGLLDDTTIEIRVEEGRPEVSASRERPHIVFLYISSCLCCDSSNVFECKYFQGIASRDDNLVTTTTPAHGNNRSQEPLPRAMAPSSLRGEQQHPILLAGTVVTELTRGLCRMDHPSYPVPPVNTKGTSVKSVV